MKKLFILFPFILSLFIFSCQSTKNQITNPNDYAAYLKFENYDSQIFAEKKEMNFWVDKIKSAPNQPPYYLKLAASQNKLFEITADVNYLNDAAKNIEKANSQLNFSSSGPFRTLARTYISQHRFQEARRCLLKADSLGADKNATTKMLFDVNMELGNFDDAKAFLQKNLNSTDFDILIRQAKYLDHTGDSKNAIATMEIAMQNAEKLKDESLKEWIYTNLGDFYGHNGQVSEAYKLYLKALKINNNGTYALKGIAWIAFSHEKNTDEALKIISKLEKIHPSPDYVLLKSQIYTFLGDHEKSKIFQNNFIKLAQQPQYGDMYNAYLVPLTTSEMALKIAQKEIVNRPLPASYDLLALALYRSNKPKEALTIIQKYVQGKTHEPISLFHQAEIQKTAGNTKDVEKLKEILQGSFFELGPNVSSKIEKI